MNYLLSLFVLLPLFFFLLSLCFKNKQEKQLSLIVLLATGAYVIAAIGMSIVWALNGFEAINEKLLTVYKTEGFAFVIQFYYDHISAAYSIVGAFIFFLVASFSRYYMHRDEGFKRFFNTLLFFLTGYNLIIFSGNFETLFIGWEAVGLCSFLLIAFYRNRYLPVKNGLKVLSIYRLSDISLILLMWMMHHLTHQNISFTQLSEAKDLAIQLQHGGMALFICIMIVLAATAKSAQLPFTSWLPRAMEGPTSSSAIFYGSLSIHIGVFVLLRTYPFWQDILWIKILLVAIGLTTGIVATFIARVQPTVKTQIAYASAAQIGIMFIEVALGFHILALVHFAGNAFLRTYQLLVSPSVLNYLVHHQYFHYKPATIISNKWTNSIYTLSIKEWNLDGFLHRFLWMPFKWIGRKLQFLETVQGKIAAIAPLVFFVYAVMSARSFAESMYTVLPVVSVGIALLLVLYAFSSRRSALTAWGYLVLAHFFILWGIMANMELIDWQQVAMYGSGILLAGIVGFISLKKTQSIDNDITLNHFHGYVYEQKTTAFIFLLSAIGLLGFPITAAFVGIDVFFTHIGANQILLIILTAFCFLFIELAAIRIYCRIFLGLHKKLNHPVAYRSS
jgi:NADH-quinone oxidoreductase subunit L